MASFKEELQRITYQNSNEKELLQNIVNTVREEAKDSHLAILYYRDDEVTKYELDNIKEILSGEGYELTVTIKEEDNWDIYTDDSPRWRLTISWYN